MNKDTLNKAIEAYKTETRNALQTVYDSLNQGQQKKILKEDAVKELFDRYGVIYKDAQTAQNTENETDYKMLGDF